MGELGRYRHREPGQEPLSVGIHVTVRGLDSHTPSEGELGRFRPCTRAGAGECWHPCHREEAGCHTPAETVERWHPCHLEEAGQSYAFGNC